MIIHYLKIAWRNLLKYKTQSVISVIGLAIGFTAFSFTLSWIRYERGYDKHIQDADRIYRVVKINEKEIGGIQVYTPEPLPDYLETTFPEIEAATTGDVKKRTYFYNNGRDSIPSCYRLTTDTSFFRVFYPEIRIDFPNPLPQYAYLLSQKISEIISANSTGFNNGFLGTVPNKTSHSNIPFDIIDLINRRMPNEDDCLWCGYSSVTYIRVQKEADVQALAKKLEHIEVEGSYQGIMSYKLIPLRKAHYRVPDSKASIKFNHLRIFAGVSLLIIFCALFNYLMLFINRVKMRSRELALRKVNGADNWQLMSLLFAEFLLILLLSIFIGGILTELLFPSFIKFSMIDAPKSFFVLEMLLYAGGVIFFSLLISWIPVRLFMKRGIRENIQPDAKSSGLLRNNFASISLLIQLLVGVLLIFCTFIFLYQYHFLNRSDIGFNRHNVNSVYNYEEEFDLAEIQQIPGVEDVLIFPGGILPRSGRGSFAINEFDNQQLPESVSFEVFNPQFPDFVTFFDIQILEGRNINEGEIGVCLINQSARKALGHDSPLGKELSGWVIVGVIPDLYIDSPLLPVIPSVYKPMQDERNVALSGGASFIYRFVPGTRSQTEKSLESLAEKKGIINGIHLSNMEETYAEYTRSERYLLVLLSFMTCVAILIAIFGIHSMIILSCNQRRKEIAIRKVNGAKVREIFMLFFWQYFMVTVVSCIVAFPIGVYIMQRWLEQYTRRVSMEGWLFVGIFILVVLIVLASIFSRVNRAAKENPADVLKSE